MKLVAQGNSFETRGFELADWQQAAVDAWWRRDDVGAHRGTLEIFTGGGKTLIALAAAERAYHDNPNLRVAVVVPTEALARPRRPRAAAADHRRRRSPRLLASDRPTAVSR